MNKFKYATIIAVVAISAVIGTISMKKNSPKTELSGLALANVEALTTLESYTLLPCYEQVTESENSQFAYLECKKGTNNSQAFDCAGGRTIQGYISDMVKIYNCVK